MKRVLATALLALSVTACGAGAVRGDLAARVGSRTITVDELADVAEAGLADREYAARVAADLVPHQRAVLDRLVRNELFEQLARRLGVTVTEAELREHRQFLDEASMEQNRAPLAEAAANGGLSPAELDGYVRATLLEAKIRDKLVPEPLSPQQVRQFDAAELEHILVPDQKRANEVIAQLRAGGDFAALARRYSTDEQTKNAGGRMPQIGRGQLDPALDRPIFEGPLNAVQGPIRTRFGFEVIRVTQRRIVKPADVPPEVRRQLQDSVSTPRLSKEVEALVADIGIEVNPRFGTWKGLSLEGVLDDLSSPPAVAPPAGGGGLVPGDPNQQPPQGDPNARPAG